MDIKMIALLIYAFFVLLFMFIDAMTAVSAKRRFFFWQSLLVSVFFPLTMPFLVIMAHEITRNYPDE